MAAIGRDGGHGSSTRSDVQRGGDGFVWRVYHRPRFVGDCPLGH
jgi:hypothetical protein